MKNLCSIAIILVLFLTSCATMMGEKADPALRTYEKVIDIPGQSKDELYVKANSWFVENFNSAESVIEYQDKEAGKIMGNYIFSFAEGMYTYNVKQTMDISIRDEKIKVSIKNPQFRATSGMGEAYHDTPYNPLETKKGIERARTEWEELSNSLLAYLETDQDW